MKAKKAISVLCLLLFGMILLCPCILLLIMSVKDYSPRLGLFGSASVGLTNINMLLHQSAFVRILKNTFSISILAMMLGAAYLFIAILAMNSFQKRILRALAALFFILPAILPTNTYVQMLQTFLPTEALVKSSVFLQVIASAENGLRFASLFVIAALFTRGDSVPLARKYVLLYIGMKCIHFLATDTGFMNAFSNPLTYEHLETCDSFLYRTGLMQASFSGYAAGYVVRLLLQLLPAVIGLLILLSIYKPNTYSANGADNGTYLPCMIMAVLPVALFCLVGSSCFKGNLMLSHPRVQQGYFNGTMIALTSAVVITCLGLLLAAASIQLNKFGIILIALLYYLSDSLLGPYMIGRELGAHDTLMGILIQNMHFILPAALIGAMILQEEHHKNILPSLTISSLGLAFSWFWGDHMTSLVTLHSTHKYPISLIMYQFLNRQGDIVAVSSSSGDVQISWLPYVLIPIIITGACFITGSVLYNEE